MVVFQTFKQFAEGLGFTMQAMMISDFGNISCSSQPGNHFCRAGMFGIEAMGVSMLGS